MDIIALVALLLAIPGAVASGWETYEKLKDLKMKRKNRDKEDGPET